MDELAAFSVHVPIARVAVRAVALDAELSAHLWEGDIVGGRSKPDRGR